MKRMLLGSMVAGLVVVCAACSSNDDEYAYGRYDNGGSTGTTFCSSYTTCDTCTPVVGCGWCEYEDGTGSCASGPSACGDHTFRWNWDPPQCPASTTTDSGTSDAAKDASDASSSDAGETSDAAADAKDAANDETTTDSSPTNIDAPHADSGVTCRPPDPGTTDCSPTSGGTLCGDRATFSCRSTAAPSSGLGCSLALSTSDANYYCCPCAP